VSAIAVAFIATSSFLGPDTWPPAVPQNVYIFFNNDTDMLDNAQSMMRIVARAASAAVLPV